MHRRSELIYSEATVIHQIEWFSAESAVLGNIACRSGIRANHVNSGRMGTQILLVFLMGIGSSFEAFI